jgi:uncharacterized delta-60 repeat protein
MKKPLATLIPLLARGLAPAAAVTTGLMSPLAIGASGDLDPTFADVGRTTNFDFGGPAWSLEAVSDDEVMFAGGDECAGWYCGYYYDLAYEFVGRMDGSGAVDASFAAERLEDVKVFDVAVQPDGKVVAVGATVENNLNRWAATIFRLERDGPLDPTFGDGGIVRLVSGLRNAASAVTLDPDGRIVVGGSENNQLMVLRLNPDGSVDNSFGSAGYFRGPPAVAIRRLHILRTGTGGYRITANSISECRVVALTPDGIPDLAFGAAGTALIGGPSVTRCNSMVAQSDGRLLVAGKAGDQAFAARLLADGAADATFAADAVSGAMQDATALAVDGDDSIIVAGRGPEGVSGALVVRLQANGELDAMFGNAGSTWIDLPTYSDVFPAIHDMTVLSDGRIIAAGGDVYGAPFMVRLLGPGGGDGPGVVGVKQASLSIEEPIGQAVVTVRRTGGDAGSVSVAYQTMPGDWDSATGGVDYTQISGRLTWNDGDFSERQIVIPIATNDQSLEQTEYFRLALDDTQGGVGLGTRNARIQIVGNAPPPAPPPPVSSPAPLPPPSGGGALELFGLMLLAVCQLVRGVRRAPPPD